jgi:hypothetical protein
MVNWFLNLSSCRRSCLYGECRAEQERCRKDEQYFVDLCRLPVADLVMLAPDRGHAFMDRRSFFPQSFRLPSCLRAVLYGIGEVPCYGFIVQIVTDKFLDVQNTVII